MGSEVFLEAARPSVLPPRHPPVLESALPVAPGPRVCSDVEAAGACASLSISLRGASIEITADAVCDDTGTGCCATTALIDPFAAAPEAWVECRVCACAVTGKGLALACKSSAST